jgi:hypothetical protein
MKRGTATVSSEELRQAVIADHAEDPPSRDALRRGPP